MSETFISDLFKLLTGSPSVTLRLLITHSRALATNGAKRKISHPHPKTNSLGVIRNIECGKSLQADMSITRCEWANIKSSQNSSANATTYVPVHVHWGNMSILQRHMKD